MKKVTKVISEGKRKRECVEITTHKGKTTSRTFHQRKMGETLWVDSINFERSARCGGER